MRSFSIDGSPSGTLDGYWQEAFGRFLHTWGLVKDLRGSALELGANPYFLTWLLMRFTPLELSLANFFGDQRGTITQRLEVVERGTPHELAMTSELFNMEEDPFPYGDDTFDVVLFCEIIEHLLMDPLHALREIHRILRPGGTVVLTTPNGVRMENVLAVLAGTNVNDPYSGFGPYGRHNREYVRADLARLLEFAGFTVDACFSADSHRIDVTGRPEYPVAAPALVGRSDDLGQYFFVRATADRPGRDGLPRFLYRSWPEDQLVD
jgi:SAM-dependent methyltransferase